MPHAVSPVLLLLLHREAPQQRHVQAWREAAALDSVDVELHHVWAGHGPVPAGMDLGSIAAAAPVLGLPDDMVALVAHAEAVPGPHLVRRLVDALLAEPSRVVDTRVLPVELTRTDGRPRGYGLAEGVDPTGEVLEEVRHAWDAQTADLTPRVTGVCCAARVGALAALDQALLAPLGTEPRLLDGAAASGLEVVVETAATVSLPVRLSWDVEVEGRVAPVGDQPVQWAGPAHPVDLPATSLGALADSLGLRASVEVADDTSPGAPFLSIVTRTQGRRLRCLEDVLTCLAGQSDRDFELLVVCHRTTAEEQASVESVVASAPAWLREAVRVLSVDRPGRSAPLNDGFTAARGRYVVAVDDDDAVLANYVATFKAGAVANEGRLLRAIAVRQDVVPLGEGADVRPVSVDDPYREWPLDFSLIDHLSDNYSQIMTVAFPREAIHGLGLRFDESLQVNEDWDLIVRCAAVLGVASIREVSSVYRWWLHTASSREAHTADEWDEARSRIQAAVSETVLLLQPEEARRLVATLEKCRRDVSAAHELAETTAEAQHATNVEMTRVAEAHDAAVAGRDAMEQKVAELRAELSSSREQLRRRAQKLRRLELVVEVQERIDAGTLERPVRPLSKMTAARLKQLAEAPVVQPRRSWLGRR